MTILIFLAVLFVLILVHEWGHYITAKWTGMRVDEFGIGFPPKLFGWKRGETVYSLNALPIGGFVKILGENGDADGEQLSAVDTTRTFSARPKWAQAIVLVAGVTMNILFAWIVLIAILMIGTEVQVGTDTAGPDAKLTVLSVAPDSPAAVLPVRAEIVSATRGEEALTTLTPEAFRDFVSAGNGEAVSISYVAGDENKTVTLTPERGLDTSRPDAAILGVQTGFLEVQTYDFVPAVKEASLQTVAMLKAITVGLVSLLANAVMGTADFSQVAGPVGIVDHVGQAASFGLTSLLYFTAVISLNLAVINLLPIPALDGGRLVFVAIESITRRPINPVWAGRLNLIGFAALMLLMVIVTYNDILKLL
ncbi:MAG: site-2 protease family protein [Candidatus Pacebacteria bacterium]|jgi:regulator of sigma E protease|nr:site-2 protease family protein [Candidatus Paceibacterota bacterium]